MQREKAGIFQAARTSGKGFGVCWLPPPPVTSQAVRTAERIRAKAPCHYLEAVSLNAPPKGVCRGETCCGGGWKDSQPLSSPGEPHRDKGTGRGALQGSCLGAEPAPAPTAATTASDKEINAVCSRLLSCYSDSLQDEQLSPKAAPVGAHPASGELPGVSPRATSSARMPWSGPGCSALSYGGISPERRCCKVLPSLQSGALQGRMQWQDAEGCGRTGKGSEEQNPTGEQHREIPLGAQERSGKRLV